MMFDVLNLYLLRHREVCLPGIGSFQQTTTGAKVDIAGKVIEPASYQYYFNPSHIHAGKSFYQWLSATQNISEWEAVRTVNDFVFNLKQVLREGKQVIWKGVGIIKPGNEHIIEFESFTKKLIFQHTLPAEKVIRQNAEHRMLVGDREKTSTEMTAMFTEQTETRANNFSPSWWAYAVIIAFLAIMLLGWHFSEHGLKVQSSGTIRKVEAKPSPTLHSTP